MPNGIQQQALSGQYGSGVANTGVQTPPKKKKSKTTDINTSTQNEGVQSGYNDETYNKGLVSTAGGYHRMNMGNRDDSVANRKE